MASEAETPKAPQEAAPAPVKGPAKGPGKGPAKGPAKGKGKTPAAEAAADAPKAEAEAPRAEDAAEAKAADASEPSVAAEVKAEATEEVKAVPKGPAKGPGKGPAKGPAKGKGKTPAAEAAADAQKAEAEAPKAEDAAEAKAADASEPSVAAEVKAEATEEAKESKATDASLGTEAKESKEKSVKFAEGAAVAGPTGAQGLSEVIPADHLNGASVDLQKAHASGPLLKRGPVYGYKFQPRWCILTNSQIIVYKDARFAERQSAERLHGEAKAYRFSNHEAPGEAVKHKDKSFGFVLDANPLAGKGRKLSYFDAENEETLTQWLQGFEKAAEHRRQAVTVHVYDTATGPIEGETEVQPLGTNNFHVGVEVNGAEWSYGFGSGTGVFPSKPTHCVPHSYRDAIELGHTALDEGAIEGVVAKLKEQWAGESYDVQKKNCCHFCAAFCDALGMTLPPWILHLSSAEVLGQNLPAQKKGRGSAIIVAAQALCT